MDDSIRQAVEGLTGQGDSTFGYRLLPTEAQRTAMLTSNKRGWEVAESDAETNPHQPSTQAKTHKGMLPVNLK